MVIMTLVMSLNGWPSSSNHARPLFSVASGLLKTARAGDGVASGAESVTGGGRGEDSLVSWITAASHGGATASSSGQGCSTGGRCSWTCTGLDTTS